MQIDIINLYIDFIIPEDTFFIEDFYPPHARCMRSLVNDYISSLPIFCFYSHYCVVNSIQFSWISFLFYCIDEQNRRKSLEKLLS